MPKPILHTALFHLPNHLSILLASADGNLHLAGANHGGTLAIKFYSKLIWLRLTFQSVSLTKRLAIFAGLLLLPVAVTGALFIQPKNTNYSFAGDNCVSKPLIFPNFVTAQDNSNFDLQKNTKLSVNGYPLYSDKVCVELENIPANSSHKSLDIKAYGLIKSSINLTSFEIPKIELNTNLNEPVSPVDGISFALNQADETFKYEVFINDASKECVVDILDVTCPLSDMDLKQGSVYIASVKQSFKDYEQTVFEQEIKLRDPVLFTQISITEEQIIYDSPEQIIITANKNLNSAGIVKVISDEQDIEVTSKTEENNLIITFARPLERQKNYTLKISDTTATDGAYLASEYNLNFSTSGGPKVAGINTENYNVTLSKTFVLTFDSSILSSQNLNNFVDISSSLGSISAQIYTDENQIIIKPNVAFSKCEQYTVSVKDGLQNIHGITGGSNWSFSFRTTCADVFSIGSSVQGRALTAYRFGSGATKILFVGGMHGNERSSYRTMAAFVDDLERRYDEIPNNKTIIVIPDVNPDGYAARTRTNVNGIDLNRNFPSNDWVTGAHLPGGVFLESGGGATPLDQPESTALASYVNSLNPRLVLTYHAVARTVISNGAGDSAAVAEKYAINSGFAHYTSSYEDGIFNYPTTGEFETWLADKKSIPTLLVELSTMSSNEFYSQRSALWAMVNI